MIKVYVAGDQASKIIDCSNVELKLFNLSGLEMTFAILSITRALSSASNVSIKKILDDVQKLDLIAKGEIIENKEEGE